MNYQDLEQGMIYESPDGGLTIYKRVPGSKIRQEVTMEWNEVNPWNRYMSTTNWDALAVMYPSIREKLEELKVMEALCRKSE